MYFRIFTLTLCSFLSFAFSAASETSSSGLVTWDEILSSERTYPFDAEVEACIAQNRLERGNGEPCIQQVLDYCPESSAASGAPRGAQRAMRCSIYFGFYWNERLERAYIDLIQHYVDVDAGIPEPGHRGLQLQSAQKIWRDWRQAKCDFVVTGQTYYPWIQVEALDCQYQMTARRALELEALRAILID